MAEEMDRRMVRGVEKCMMFEKIVLCLIKGFGSGKKEWIKEELGIDKQHSAAVVKNV
jgi:hypothetical protein